jgi:hypothetical protein
MAEMYEQRFNPVQQYMDADTGDDMPGRDANTPGAGAAHQARQVPALYPRSTSPGLPDEHLTPRPVEQTGPQGRFTRWLDEQLQRPGRWWRRKQAERDARMGLED